MALMSLGVVAAPVVGWRVESWTTWSQHGGGHSTTISCDGVPRILWTRGLPVDSCSMAGSLLWTEYGVVAGTPLYSVPLLLLYRSHGSDPTGAASFRQNFPP